MDFVVIGGGVLGSGVAWELASRGAEVVLLEAQQIAAGASGGLGERGVRANGRDLRELPLMKLAYELWADLENRIGSPTGYERSGGLELFERDIDRDAAPARAWVQNQFGIPTHLVSGETLRDMEPYLNRRIIGALHCPKDGTADHTLTTRGLARAAQRLGAVIREKTPVIKVERRGDHITAVITAQQERITVDHSVLFLSNAHVPVILLEELGFNLPVWQLLPQVVLTDPIGWMPVQHLISHGHRLISIKAVGQGRVMFSGGWRGRWDLETGLGVTDPDKVRGNVAEGVAVYPGLEDIAIAEATADRVETFTPDSIPIIDRVPGLTNAFFATGWSGHGWAIAPAVCKLLAAWAHQGEVSSLLSPFGYNRFSQ